MEDLVHLSVFSLPFVSSWCDSPPFLQLTFLQLPERILLDVKVDGIAFILLGLEGVEISEGSSIHSLGRS